MAQSSSDGTTGSTAPHRPPEDNEEVYFDGHSSLKGEIARLCLHALIALLVLLLGGWLSIALGGVWLLAILPVLAVALAIAGWPVLINRTRRFKITNYRIDFERGLLTRRIDTLELWHVEDIRMHQSLLNRILGVGTLTVVSDDSTTPSLVIPGLSEPRKLFDLVKQRVISVKRQRGVLKLDL